MKIRKILIIFAVCFIILGFTACKERDEDTDTPTDYYTVSFQTNEGSLIPNMQVEAGTSINEPQEPTKNNRVFDGWFLNSQLTDAATFPYVVTHDVTFYARWVPYSYVVTYVTNCDVELPDLKQFEFSSIFEPSINNPNHMLEGWYYDSQFKNKVTFPFAIENDITIYAKWIRVFTVSFDSNTPYFSLASMLVEINSLFDEPEISLPNGYRFDGWYWDSEFTTKVKFPFDITKDILLYAKLVEQCTIIYYTLPTTTDLGIEEYVYDKGTTIEFITPHKIGYALEGWYTNRDYLPTNRVESPHVLNNSIALFANWLEILSISLFDQTTLIDTIMVEIGTELSEVQLPTPTRTAGSFYDWYLDEHFTARPNYQMVITQSFALYAKFSFDLVLDDAELLNNAKLGTVYPLSYRLSPTYTYDEPYTVSVGVYADEAATQACDEYVQLLSSSSAKIVGVGSAWLVTKYEFADNRTATHKVRVTSVFTSQVVKNAIDSLKPSPSSYTRTELTKITVLSINNVSNLTDLSALTSLETLVIINASNFDADFRYFTNLTRLRLSGITFAKKQAINEAFEGFDSSGNAKLMLEIINSSMPNGELTLSGDWTNHIDELYIQGNANLSVLQVHGFNSLQRLEITGNNVLNSLELWYLASISADGIVLEGVSNLRQLKLKGLNALVSEISDSNGTKQFNLRDMTALHTLWFDSIDSDCSATYPLFAVPQKAYTSIKVDNTNIMATGLLAYDGTNFSANFSSVSDLELTRMYYKLQSSGAKLYTEKLYNALITKSSNIIIFKCLVPDFLDLTSIEGNIYLSELKNTIDLYLVLPAMFNRIDITNLTDKPAVITFLAHNIQGNTLNISHLNPDELISHIDDGAIDISGIVNVRFENIPTLKRVVGGTVVHISKVNIFTNLYISGCASLEEVELVGTNTAYANKMVTITNNPNLVYVKIKASITNVNISNNNALEYLDLSYNSLTSVDISTLKGLTTLMISDNSNLNSIVGSKSVNTKLTVLYAPRCGFTSMDFLVSLVAGDIYDPVFANLQVLDLVREYNSASGINAGGITNFKNLKSYTKLKELYIGGNAFGTNIELNSQVTLTHLNLGGTRTSNVTGTNSSVYKVLKNNFTPSKRQQLVYLDLYHTGLTAANINELFVTDLTGDHSLVRLKISHNGIELSQLHQKIQAISSKTNVVINGIVTNGQLILN